MLHPVTTTDLRNRCFSLGTFLRGVGGRHTRRAWPRAPASILGTGASAFMHLTLANLVDNTAPTSYPNIVGNVH